MKIVRLLVVLLLAFSMVGCQPIENNARDAAAGLSGSIVAAQVKYHDTCVATPSQDICQLINKGVSGENALISTLETYCGWQVSVAPPDPNAKCQPVKNAQAALVAAIANATTLTLQIKGAL